MALHTVAIPLAEHNKPPLTGMEEVSFSAKIHEKMMNRAEKNNTEDNLLREIHI